MKRLLIPLAALLLAGPLSAKELVKPDPARAVKAAPLLQTINGNPLQINIGSDNSYQVFNAAVPGLGQIYPSTATQTADMGWFVRVGGTLYTPNFDEHPGGTATGNLGPRTDFIEVSLEPVTGLGTVDSPFTLRTITSIGSTGLIVAKRDFYIQGTNYITHQFRIINTTAAPVQAKVYLGSDIFLASSDSGVPIREPVSGAPGGQTCGGISPVYNILHIPLTPANRYTAAQYANVWSQIGVGTLDNTVATGCIDNGAALEWDINISGGGATSVLAGTSFGDVPPITQFNIVNVDPAQAGLDTVTPVRITGYGFQANTTFTFGAGITVSNVVILNANTATAVVTVSPTTQLGYRDVIATRSPGGTRATLFDGFAVLDKPLWNYMVSPVGTNTNALTCVRNKFPGVPATNATAWAPSEGDFYREAPGFPGIYQPPWGLARAIMDCFLSPLVWDSGAGTLMSAYCWENPTPWYIGDYPDLREVQFRLFLSVNGVCTEPPPGTSLYEFTVPVIRQLYYPPPLVRNGFEL